ncbi:MAG: biotin/lipoyl-binding protein [Bacteroidota bacterium]|nr:biotin/lipoyl-binding protein [Bacteroidota bacterium]
MKKTIYFLIMVFLVSCGSEKDAETIKQEIGKKRKEIQSLKLELSELEDELEKLTDGEDDKFKVPVKVKELQAETFNHYFEASGVLEPVMEAFISPEINAQIEKVYVEEGEQVSKGQLLARLNTNVTNNSIEEVETSLELARTLFKKQQELWEKISVRRFSSWRRKTGLSLWKAG